MQTGQTRTADKSTARLVLWILAEAPQALTLEEITSKVVLDSGQAVTEALDRLTEAGVVVHRDTRWALSADIPGVDLWSESAGDDAFTPDLRVGLQQRMTWEGEDYPLLVELRSYLYDLATTAGPGDPLVVPQSSVGIAAKHYARQFLDGTLSAHYLSILFNDVRRLLGFDSEYLADLATTIARSAVDAFKQSASKSRASQLIAITARYLSPDEEALLSALDAASAEFKATVTELQVALDAAESANRAARPPAGVRHWSRMVRAVNAALSANRAASPPAAPARSVRPGWFFQLIDKIAPHPVRPATSEVTVQMKVFFDTIGPPPGWIADVDAVEATHGH